MSLELEEVSSHLEWLQALAVTMVADCQAAEDLVQQALQEAAKKKDWQPGKLKPWLVGTVRNLSRQYFRTESRRRKREQRVVDAAENYAQGVRGASTATSSEELVEQVESQKLLSSAVMDLQEPYRETLLMFYYGGCTQQEVADELKISVRTVETRLRRARKQLRKRLEGQYGKESWALGVLPLIKRYPPPAMPPSLTVVGPGSLGSGWWAAAGLVLSALGWGWLGTEDADPESVLPTKFEPVVAQVEPELQLDSVVRNPLISEEVAMADPAFQVQDFIFQERGTGVGLEGLKLHVYFLHPANAEQRLKRGAPEFFNPQDRIWWKVGEASGVSDAQGGVRFDVPQQTTHVMARLITHSATHSLSGYSLRYKTFSRKEIAGQSVPLIMVRRTGTASGYVVDTENNPMANVLVDVFFEAPNGLTETPVMTIPTQPNGSFSIPNMACDQGGFRLRPRGEGFVAIRSLRTQRYAGFGVDYPGISLAMAPATKQTKILVQDERGQPIAGARVSAKQLTEGDPDLSYVFGTYLMDWKAVEVTGVDGMAVFENLPAGELLWRSEHSNYLVQDFELQESSQSRSITLHSGNTLRVEVQSAGKNIQGASVGLYSKTQRRTLLSNAQGMVEFSGLSTQEPFHITVAHPEFAFWVAEDIRAGGSLHTEVVDLQKGHSISGQVEWSTQGDSTVGKRPRIFLREVPAQSLPSFPKNENRRAETGWLQVAGIDEALADDEGNFSFQGLPDLHAEVWFGLRRRPLGIAQAQSGDSDVHLYPELGMANKVTLDVQVTDELSGRPVTTYYLILTNHDGESPVTFPVATVKSGKGRYRQPGLDPGMWSVVIWAPQGFTTKRMDPRYIGPGPQALDVALAAARSLRLRFVEEDGEAMEGVEISARTEDGSMLLQGGLMGGGFREWSTTDARGQVSLSHVPETQPYRLLCTYQGREHTFALPGARVEGELRELVFPAAKRD